MSEPFIIYIDRLKEGVVQKIDALLSSDFFEVDEPDLHFKDAVKVSGEAYLTDEDLVLHLTASTIAQMACSICNRMVPWPLCIKGYYHAEPLSDIRGARFDYRPVLREALLVELPKVAECSGGCLERKTIEPFLHKEKQDNPTHYFPFTDLKLPRS
jgi:hypothetical protein